MSEPTPSTPTVAPRMDRRWIEPAPVIVIGILAFLVAGVVASVVDAWNGTAATCWTGAVIGALGFALFAAQRRSARRGDKGAQRGLL